MTMTVENLELQLMRSNLKVRVPMDSAITSSLLETQQKLFSQIFEGSAFLRLLLRMFSIYPFPAMWCLIDLETSITSYRAWSSMMNCWLLPDLPKLNWSQYPYCLTCPGGYYNFVMLSSPYLPVFKRREPHINGVLLYLPVMYQNRLMVLLKASNHFTFAKFRTLLP